MRVALRILLAAVLVASPVRAEVVRVAAAASLSPLADELVAAFEAESGHDLQITLGSSGILFAQIISKAPFSIFMSADLFYPGKLVQAGLAAPPGVRVYARGRLALWIPEHSPLPVSNDLRELLISPRLRRLAIANPRVAPYGTAARQLLESLGLERHLQQRLVLGDSVAQAAHLARAGGADAALLAGSLSGIPELSRSGRWVEVSPQLYEPVEHGLVVVGRESRAARRFVEWLLGPGGERVLQRHGLAAAR